MFTLYTTDTHTRSVDTYPTLPYTHTNSISASQRYTQVIGRYSAQMGILHYTNVIYVLLWTPPPFERHAFGVLSTTQIKSSKRYIVLYHHRVFVFDLIQQFEGLDAVLAWLREWKNVQITRSNKRRDNVNFFPHKFVVIHLNRLGFRFS